jgi:hypothetical protein
MKLNFDQGLAGLDSELRTSLSALGWRLDLNPIEPGEHGQSQLLHSQAAELDLFNCIRLREGELLQYWTRVKAKVTSPKKLQGGQSVAAELFEYASLRPKGDQGGKFGEAQTLQDPAPNVDSVKGGHCAQLQLLHIGKHSKLQLFQSGHRRQAVDLKPMQAEVGQRWQASNLLYLEERNGLELCPAALFANPDMQGLQIGEPGGALEVLERTSDDSEGLQVCETVQWEVTQLNNIQVLDLQALEFRKRT